MPTPGTFRVASGEAELLADADRPGGWLLLIDRVRQSYVDLDDPTYLDFEYLQAFAELVGALPPGPLAVTHIGGGAATFPRWIAATRPGSPQIVLEPDADLIAAVRAHLPFPRAARIRVRPQPGREGLAGLKDASAHLIVLDAFLGGRVPAELTTVECASEMARVLREDGVLLANVADGPPLRYLRRVAASFGAVFGHLVLEADPAVLRGRRYGNVLLAASRAPLPVERITRAAAAAPFPRRVVAGERVGEFAGGARPFTDADAERSPAPPEEAWKVADVSEDDW
jgi:spermidine synthase